jgi:hypothetical protein
MPFVALVIVVLVHLVGDVGDVSAHQQWDLTRLVMASRGPAPSKTPRRLGLRAGRRAALT